MTDRTPTLTQRSAPMPDPSMHAALPDGRQSLSLAGTWEACIDPDGSLTLENLADWQPLPVPANWHVAGLPNYAGVVWYRRRFTLPAELHNRPLRLEFGGVDYRADVWLDGRLLGGHSGYFQPFGFAVGRLGEGEHHLLVRVDSPRESLEAWPTRKVLIKGIFAHHDCRPGGNSFDQDGNTGGIWNDVQLAPHTALRIQRLQVSTPPQGPQGRDALLVVRCWIENTLEELCAARIELSLTPADPDARDYHAAQDVQLQPGVQECTLVQHLEEPKRWWTWDQGTPHLYTLRAEISLEDGRLVVAQSQRVGVRDVRIEDDGSWWLNGRRVFVRGTNIIPTQWLSTYTPELIERDVALMRAANMNAVRVHAHVNRREFYSACDEAGLLVWQDFALQWAYDSSAAFLAEAGRQIRDMVRHLSGHPSIAVWCCHNEPFGDRHTLGVILEQAVREEDATRAVVVASDTHQHAYPGWFYGSTAEYIALPGAPLLTEYGAQALPSAEQLRAMLPPEAHWPRTQEQWNVWSYHNFQYQPTFQIAGVERGSSLEEFVANSQAYQAELLKQATELYRAHKYRPVTGLFQFMFVESWDSITWAVVNRDRTPKAGYEALRTALQPVLVTFRTGTALPRHALGTAWDLMAITRVAVVNDLPEPFAAARLVLSLERAGQAWVIGEHQLDLPADGLVRLPSHLELLEAGARAEINALLEPMRRVLHAIEAGSYRLTARLYSVDGRLLSENAESIALAPVRHDFYMPFLPL